MALPHHDTTSPTPCPSGLGVLGALTTLGLDKGWEEMGWCLSLHWLLLRAEPKIIYLLGFVAQRLCFAGLNRGQGRPQPVIRSHPPNSVLYQSSNFYIISPNSILPYFSYPPNLWDRSVLLLSYFIVCFMLFTNIILFLIIGVEISANKYREWSGRCWKNS